MPEELKNYADEHGISLSEIVQEGVKDRMNEVEQDRETELRNEKQELESTIEYLEQELTQYQNELNEVEEELDEITVEQDEIVGDIKEAVVKTFGHEDAQDLQYDYDFSADEIVAARDLCEDRMIGLVDDDFSDKLKEFLDQNGFDAEAPLDTDDISVRKESMKFLQNNLTPEEEKKIENYAEREFDL